MERLANYLAEHYVRKRWIDPEIKLIYQVGFDILFSTILQVMTVLLAGLALHHVQEAVLFLAGFYLLRQYGGGYHARSRMRCLGMMVLLYIGSVYGVIMWTGIGKNLQWYILAGLFVVSVRVYLRYVPVPNPAKVFIPEHTRRNRRKAIVTLWIWILGIGTAIVYANAQIWMMMTITLFVVTMLLLVRKIKGK